MLKTYPTPPAKIKSKWIKDTQGTNLELPKGQCREG